MDTFRRSSIDAAPRRDPRSKVAIAGGLFVLIIHVLLSGCGPGPPTTSDPFVRYERDYFTSAEYAARRDSFMTEIPGAAAVLLGADAPLNDYRFFQNNDLVYFTGVEVPDAVLVMDATRGESVLFFTTEPREAKGEGIDPDLVTDTARVTGIDRALPRETLGGYLEELTGRVEVLYTNFRPGETMRVNTAEEFRARQRTMTDDPWDGRLTRELQFVEVLRERYSGIEVRDCSRLIQQLRKYKSAKEIELIRRAAQISVRAHLALMRSTEVGVSEKDLGALFEFVSLREGAQELAYYVILMSGPHHPWGHYHAHDRVLEEGDFVILDAGADYGYYNADVSSSFPADGSFDERQRELYMLGYQLYRVCLEHYAPGITLADVGQEVRAWLEANGYDPGEDRFRGIIRWGGWNHAIGMATHDVMTTMSGPDEVLQPGYVFACDINMPYDATFGIRIEDTVVITEDGAENLSTGLPRTAQEIEALMAKPGTLQVLQRGPGY